MVTGNETNVWAEADRERERGGEDKKFIINGLVGTIVTFNGMFGAVVLEVVSVKLWVRIWLQISVKH